MVKFKCPKCGAVHEVLSPNSTVTCPHGKPVSRFNEPTVCVLVKR